MSPDQQLDWFVDSLIELVRPLGKVLPTNCEIVLHDLRKLPQSIVAIAGDLTGRTVGGLATDNLVQDPATSLLFEQIARGLAADLVSYEIKTSDSRRIQSATTIIRDLQGAPVVVVCINTELENPGEATHYGSGSLHTGVAGAAAHRPANEIKYLGAEPSSGSNDDVVVRDMSEMASALLGQAIAAEGIPVSMMKKRHKVRVVARLHAGGMFQLRDAMDLVAQALDVSKFSIYNYLNEMNAAQVIMEPVS
jgi:predicted transcriptional regulator YheO